MGKVLVACEESQAVTKEFRKIGVEAYSCDMQLCSGGHPEWHIRGDATKVIWQGWDMIIAFPPCTYLTTTGNRWFNVEEYGHEALDRFEKRQKAIEFFMTFAKAPCPRVVIENPVGVMSSEWRKPDQTIHPWQFGDPCEKRTCLWLRGVPKLKPTKIVSPPPRRTYSSGRSLPTWYSKSFNLPKKQRAMMRSKTFPGIAEAMATQWGLILKKGNK